jgi:hypothetical protein
MGQPARETRTGLGEAFVNQVYEAMIANADAWQRTLLFITFDERGGTSDHVDPGWGAVQTDAHRGPDGFAFDRYGVRFSNPAGIAVGAGRHGVPFAELEVEVRSHFYDRHRVELVRRRSRGGWARQSGRRGPDLRGGARREGPPGRPDVHGSGRLRRAGGAAAGSPTKPSVCQWASCVPWSRRGRRSRSSRRGRRPRSIRANRTARPGPVGSR